MKNATSALVAVGILLVAFAGSARSQPLVFGGPTMGTTYHVRLAAKPSSLDAMSLHHDVESLLADIDRQMSTYRPDSELSRFNRASAGVWFPVSPATAEVVAAAQSISRKTNGALDVTVGPLVRLWHFGPTDPTSGTAKGQFKPPSDEALNGAMKAVGYQKLEVRSEPPALRKQVDSLEVDLSAIAPGYAVDRMSALLTDRGLKNFLVEIGGEVRAVGERSVGKPWRVAVERPLAERREMHFVIPLANAAVATAGDYRKFFEYGGRRYSHILDPSTGRPVGHSLASVTVVADTCIEADGWDTPLVVLGAERGFACAEEQGVAALFVTRDADGETKRPTTAWRARFPK